MKRVRQTLVLGLTRREYHTMVGTTGLPVEYRRDPSWWSEDKEGEPVGIRTFMPGPGVGRTLNQLLLWLQNHRLELLARRYANVFLPGAPRFYILIPISNRTYTSSHRKSPTGRVAGKAGVIQIGTSLLLVYHVNLLSLPSDWKTRTKYIHSKCKANYGLRTRH
jgi:hypothetical protein